MPDNFERVAQIRLRTLPDNTVELLADLSNGKTASFSIVPASGTTQAISFDSTTKDVYAGSSELKAATVTTWAAKPAAVGKATDWIFVTDIGVDGSLWVSNGTDWKPLHPITLGRQNTFDRTPDTDTNSRTHYQLVIPGGVIPPNGILQIEPVWTHPNSATTKNLTVTLGAASLYSKARTTTTLDAPIIKFNPRNSRSSHLIPFNGTGLNAVAASGSVSTSAIDVSVDQTLTVASSWGTAGTGTNNITLESVEVVLRP